jgi:hypothetical protein
MSAAKEKEATNKTLSRTQYFEFINYKYSPMGHLFITARGRNNKNVMEGWLSVENKNPKSVANRRVRHLRCHINALSRMLERFHKSVLKCLSFLLFKEKEPKHRVAENLHPLHALATFYFCLFAPTLTFFWLMPMGFLVLCAGETLLILAVLEAMHILFDR